MIYFKFKFWSTKKIKSSCVANFQERCPSLQQRVVSGIPSCAEKVYHLHFLSEMKRIKTIVDNLLLHKRHLGMPSWSWENVAGESETKDSWGKDSIPHSSLCQFLGWYNPYQDNNHPITNNLPGRQCLKNGRREEVPSEESEQLQRWSIPDICHLYQQRCLCKYLPV